MGAPSDKGTSLPSPTPGTRTAVPGYLRFRKIPDFGSNNCFDFEEATSFLCTPIVTDEKGHKGLVASPVFLTDPCQGGSANGPLRTQTITVTGEQAGANFTVLTLAGTYAGSWHIRKIGTAGATQTAFLDPEQDYGSYGVHTVSIANTALVVSLDLRNLKKSLAIVSTASAGTFTLVVEASNDGFVSSDVTVDSIAAAASQVKQYVEATVGATTAVSPLAFRYLKLTFGAAGVGNTVTVDIGAK